MIRTSNRRPSCCGRSIQLRRHASSAIAMFPSLSHSSLAYYGAVAVPLQANTPPTITAAAADWQMPTFAPSRTRPSPKAAVAYVCGEGTNVESLARQPCEHRSIGMCTFTSHFDEFICCAGVISWRIHCWAHLVASVIIVAFSTCVSLCW